MAPRSEGANSARAQKRCYAGRRQTCRGASSSSETGAATMLLNDAVSSIGSGATRPAPNAY
eukprot:12819816-Alexandrium_andersonii.AAC.1